MTRTLIHRCWPGLLALAWLLNPPGAGAWGNGAPIPIATDAQWTWRFDVKLGADAFTVPAGPWYSYFPVDPNLLAQPRATAFPTWPTQFPGNGGAPMQPVAPVPGLTYFPSYQSAPAMPQGYNVNPVNYYEPLPLSGYWYGR